MGGYRQGPREDIEAHKERERERERERESERERVTDCISYAKCLYRRRRHVVFSCYEVA